MLDRAHVERVLAEMGWCVHPDGSPYLHGTLAELLAGLPDFVRAELASWTRC